jgi:hypothetical protein
MNFIKQLVTIIFGLQRKYLAQEKKTI